MAARAKPQEPQADELGARRTQRTGKPAAAPRRRRAPKGTAPETDGGPPAADAASEAMAASDAPADATPGAAVAPVIADISFRQEEAAGPPESTASEARERADKIRAGWNSIFESRDDLMALIHEASERRDDQALGYGSFIAYVESEFGLDKLPRLTGEMRDSWSRALAEDGLTVREIATLVGSSKSAVARATTDVVPAGTNTASPGTEPIPGAGPDPVNDGQRTGPGRRRGSKDKQPRKPRNPSAPASPATDPEPPAEKSIQQHKADNQAFLSKSLPQPKRDELAVFHRQLAEAFEKPMTGGRQ